MASGGTAPLRLREEQEEETVEVTKKQRTKFFNVSFCLWVFPFFCL